MRSFIFYHLTVFTHILNVTQGENSNADNEHKYHPVNSLYSAKEKEFIGIENILKKNGAKDVIWLDEDDR